MGRIRRLWQSGRIGKIALGAGGVVALLLVCCVVSVVLSLVNQAGQALGIVPTSTITPIPSATPLPTDVPPTPTDAPTPTNAPTPTDAPTPTPGPTDVPPTPTIVEFPTFAPSRPVPTIATDPAGIAPANGTCPIEYYVKISRNKLAHVPSNGSYDRTNPIHCYASLKDAFDAGYPAAGN